MVVLPQNIAKIYKKVANFGKGSEKDEGGKKTRKNVSFAHGRVCIALEERDMLKKIPV